MQRARLKSIRPMGAFSSAGRRERITSSVVDGGLFDREEEPWHPMNPRRALASSGSRAVSPGHSGDDGIAHAFQYITNALAGVSTFRALGEVSQLRCLHQMVHRPNPECVKALARRECATGSRIQPHPPCIQRLENERP